MDLKKLFSQIPQKAKLAVFAALLAIGVGLLLLGGSSGEKVSDPENMGAEAIAQYERELEKRIAELCKSVKGVSNVTVAVSLEGGFEYVYAKDLDGKIVTVGSGSSASGIILKKETPKIAGVGIVCSGGGDENVKNRLISLVSAAYGVGTNRIFVTEAKK